ncbi:ABC transporter permease [Pseudoflavonifractor sp. MSJ-37]|uniref:ABC transporter permease n=1 Tax=Pseudoflavonifractor sp. MSJ-37 TaxID=2841531 RepID=UPI001C11A51A|nr:ABC transporter permease [Pseudoflavonifractor sp. MSJ-37]MBU5435268.1 ABC transporter permease [Pseudoflavonifractor sp. MSJ-37]
MLDIITGFLEATLRMACPIMLASLGALFTARSGIINFAMEGIMITGAFFGVYGSYLTGSPWLGALLGMAGGLAASLILGIMSITVKVDQVVAGTGVNVLFLGLTSYFCTVLYPNGQPSSVNAFQSVVVPGLSSIPVIGVFFRQNLLTYITFLLVPVIWYLLNKTTFGLCLRSVGEQPHAADSLGIHVDRMRYIAIILAGLLGGLGGAALSLGQVSCFIENMTSGRGYVAWSAVTVGKYSPIGIMGASILFGGAEAVQLRLQAMGIEIPQQFFQMLPYVLTMVVLAGVVGRTVGPKAIGKPFVKGER